MAQQTVGLLQSTSAYDDFVSYPAVFLLLVFQGSFKWEARKKERES